jgi:general secretion pathway protein F
VTVYVWKGLAPNGREKRGTRDADNVKALRVLLKKEQGVLLTSALEESASKKATSREIDFGKYFRRVSTLDLAIATRQLATLLKSGVPLVESLTALIDQMENPELKGALTQIRDRVNEGISLHEALRVHSKVFPPIYANMVEAGEASGTLELVLARLADFLESSNKLSTKVTSALAYPAFMGLMSMVTIGIMMVVVVPKITSIFEDFAEALPWYTRLLIFTSDIVTGYWWLIAAVVGFAIWYFRRWQATPTGRATWDKFILDLPLVGKLLMMVAVARFARTLSTLLASGVPLLRAMEITRNVLGNVELMRVIEEAASSIREGESIAAPLKRSGRFPPIVTHMIAIGERTGQLEEMLENVASAYDQQVDARVQAMTSLLEPMMIVVMGGISGGIAFSILVPLMRINEFVQ